MIDISFQRTPLETDIVSPFLGLSYDSLEVRRVWRKLSCQQYEWHPWITCSITCMVLPPSGIFRRLYTLTKIVGLWFAFSTPSILPAGLRSRLPSDQRRPMNEMLKYGA